MLAKLNRIFIKLFGPVFKVHKRQIVKHLIKTCIYSNRFSCVIVYEKYGLEARVWYTNQLRTQYCKPRGLNTMNPFFAELQNLPEYPSMTLNYRDQLVVKNRQKWLHYLLSTL